MIARSGNRCRCGNIVRGRPGWARLQAATLDRGEERRAGNEVETIEIDSVRRDGCCGSEVTLPDIERLAGQA